MSQRKWIPYPRYIFRKTIALELIKKYIPIESYFLEIGGGAGDFSRALIKMGLRGKIIDFSEKSYQTIKELSKQTNNLRIEKADFLKFNEREKYDLIIMFEVLEHISQENLVMERINYILKDGGYALISVPARKNLWDAWDNLAGHVKRYEKEELKQLLQNGGFSIVQFYSYGFPFLNIIKIFRKFMTGGKNNSNDKKMATQKSGLNIVQIPIIGMIFNEWTLYPFIQISKIFNRLDLAEGYICLVRKYKN